MSVVRFGKDIPTFVRNLRHDLNLTQAELANRLGVTPQYVSNVERGQHKDPIMFCSVLLQVIPKDRETYLLDLMLEAMSTKAHNRLKKIS